MNKNEPSKKAYPRNIQKAGQNLGEETQKNKLRPLYPSCSVFHLPHAFIE
ncbi:MAG: hypothetical protein KIS65_07310 [Nitrosomonas sp.]|nr:hypothetical protein [Nitrosomonas sp.]